MKNFTQKLTGDTDMKTVVEEILDEIKSMSLIDDPFYMHFESRRQFWLEKEKSQIIEAANYPCQSMCYIDEERHGEDYFKCKFKD